MMAANLVANVLGADGVVLGKVHGGMAHIDLGLVAELCEELGVKTTLFSQVYGNSGSLTDYVLFSSDSLNAIVSNGNLLEIIRLSQADRILGGTPETPVFHQSLNQKAGDKVIDIEYFLLAGAYDYLGSSKLIAAEY